MNVDVAVGEQLVDYRCSRCGMVAQASVASSGTGLGVSGLSLSNAQLDVALHLPVSTNEVVRTASSTLGEGSPPRHCRSDQTTDRPLRVTSPGHTLSSEESTMDDLVAKASTTISAPVSNVWDALVNPAIIRQYMFGTNVTSEWKEGSPISWKGEWKGQAYEDKGAILKLRPEKLLQYSHYSPLMGKPDKPENYHTVTIELSSGSGGTQVVLTQDNNATEEAKQHSQENWEMMLAGLKKLLESAQPGDVRAGR